MSSDERLSKDGVMVLFSKQSITYIKLKYTTNIKYLKQLSFQPKKLIIFSGLLSALFDSVIMGPVVGFIVG